MSLSTIGSVSVFIDPKAGDQKVTQPIIPSIVPIGATLSTLHFFGYGGDIRRIKCKVYSDSSESTLRGYAKAGTTVAYTNHRGSQGNFVIMNYSSAYIQALNYSDSWYDVTCELLAQ